MRLVSALSGKTGPAVRAKRCFDVVISLGLLIALLPLIVLIGACVRVLSGPPTIYRARRAGRHGACFQMLKFRTMVAGAGGPRITGVADDRVTGVGRVLRRTKLDELPQLVNVLRGEMSMVGPRPEDPRFVALYTDEERQVLSVRPGVTSPAALEYWDEARLLKAPENQRELDYVREVMRVKLALDLDYVRRRTLWLDIAVLVRTVHAVLRPRGAARRRAGELP